MKAQNAQLAGASGVIIFNEGTPGRTGLNGISLIDAAGNQIVPTIPVASVALATGEALYNDYQSHNAARVSLSIDAIVDPNRTDWNVIADSKGGDTNHTVVVDAPSRCDLPSRHARQRIRFGDDSRHRAYDEERQPGEHLRFIWFGGEELGLLGSKFYVNTLNPNDINHIGYDLDADVT